ncbi:unnamed protein product [Cladocopium goreaui]|uniref:Uncharacterized protein n=1 Tax=Cladocopium goreaui TaxID=2562237 RepID=A0A9P1DB75_9DINO|nr:unnamed protein product [Cladocopium goreaui]
MSNKVSDHAHVETEDKEKKGKEEKEEVTLKLPKPTDDARAKWIVHCNRNVLKDSMVSSASFEECSIKTYAMRPALEWALINLHGDSSLEDMFMLLYRLFTGHTKLKLGPPGTAEEDTRRWAHTFATLVAYLKPETMEHGFLASFINVFAHNFDELWTSDGQSALPKPPGNELGRSQSRELVHERFLTELRSWILDHKERLVWPSGGDEDWSEVGAISRIRQSKGLEGKLDNHLMRSTCTAVSFWLIEEWRGYERIVQHPKMRLTTENKFY